MSGCPALQGTRLLRKGSADNLQEIFFPLLAPSSAFMAALDVTGRRLVPRGGFPSELSVLSTAAPGPFSKVTPSMFWSSPPGPPRMSSTLVSSLSRCSRQSSDGTSARSGQANSRR
ncbi:hypothetical protein DPMN_114437 [Dreissena polymorpha]|uniref:Uncharacterized protein n=1 Tax=Dreissena polymorpha TaxID=45954 RepID=A0A9D4KK57_DREPO|nr:hypothetical protein DPMN_114437 [Dreissena polymorpha]